MRDLADHPFSPENIARESGESASERAWMRWSGEVERLLGHDLDGCDPAAFDAGKDDGCGYSIDEAYQRWQAGATAHAYVAMVTSRDRYDGGAFVRTAPRKRERA